MNLGHEELPEVRFSQVIRGHGALAAGDKEIAVSRFSLTREKYNPAGHWHFEFHLGDGTTDENTLHSALTSLLDSSADLPRLSGTTDSGVCVEIPDVYWSNRESTTLVGTAYEVVLGADPLAWQPATQHVTIELSQTPLAIPEKGPLVQSYTGEVTSAGDAERYRPHEIETSLGTMQFALHYKHEEVYVAGVKSWVQVPVPRLYLDLEEGDTHEHPAELVRELENEIESFVRLLSFLSRQQVTWTQIKILSVPGPPQSLKIFPVQCARLRAVPVEYSERKCRMVNPYRMPKGGLSAMVRSLDASELRPSLMQGMLYTVIARGSKFVEPKMVNAFTALEAICNSAARHEGQDKILRTSAFRRIRKELVKTLDRVFADSELAPESLEAVKNKLSELNRFSISRGIIRLIERTGINWEDVWLPGTTLADCVPDLYAVRSRFLHGGHTASALAMDTAGQRALVIAERLIYKMLGGEEDWLENRGLDDWNFAAAEAALDVEAASQQEARRRGG